MHRFFIDSAALLEGNRAVLRDPAEVRHLVRVLRATEGEAVELCVDHSQEWVGVIESLTDEAVIFANLEKKESDRESPMITHLFQGLPKGDKMEWIVQKTVELGVNAITPVQMTRSVSKISDDKDNRKKTERFQKIADEAAKQSKRLARVSVNPIVKTKGILEAISTFDLFLIAYELEDSVGLNQIVAQLQETGVQPKNIGVLIGPEGGIDGPELELLLQAGARSVTLGPRIMRTETAGIALITMLQFAFGDLGGQ